MRYLIYLRVSTKDQDNRSQEDACMNYLRAKHGNDSYEYLIFSDKMSSKKGVYDRKGSKELIRTMKRGDTILAWRLDRLSRIKKDSNDLVSEIQSKGITLVLIDQPNIDNDVVLGVYIGLASEELKTLKRRIGEKFKSKRARGEVIGQVPYGYSLDQNILVPIKVGNELVNKPAILIPNLQEQETVQVMIGLQNEGLSYRNIAKRLIDLGRLNRGGKPFGFANIHRILSRINRPKDHSQSHLVQEHHSALVSQQ